MMKKPWLYIICIMLLGSIAIPLLSSKAAPAVDKIARGKYLVERVGMCADCHSQRNEKGEFIKEKWLEGGPLDFAPIHPFPDWAANAPPIAGLPGFKEADAIKLLETALDENGKPLRPPMPSYRMSHEDAVAVVAYLKSLKPVKK